MAKVSGAKHYATKSVTCLADGGPVTRPKLWPEGFGPGNSSTGKGRMAQAKRWQDYNAEAQENTAAVNGDMKKATALGMTAMGKPAIYKRAKK